MPRQFRTAGILGGMGPDATLDLLQRIIRHTEASDDADHARCLVDQNPRVPSRIKYLLEGGDVSPGPCLADMARGLEANGADFLCIACNTAHNWYNDVAGAVQIPVLNLIEIASQSAARLLAGKGCKVGILASPAVVQTKLYEKPLADIGLGPVYPDAEYGDRLLTLIKRIKAGDLGDNVRAEFVGIAQHLAGKGAQALIIACTDLSALDVDLGLPAVDAADALARVIVEKAGCKLKGAS